jgi:hypothetical protein
MQESLWWIWYLYADEPGVLQTKSPCGCDVVNKMCAFFEEAGG